MLYLANPSGAAVAAAMNSGLIGAIDTPAQGNIIPADAVHCVDNGCFGKGYPGDDGFLTWLANRSSPRSLCLFATAPDVVGDAAATLARSRPFLPKIRALGYPAALVAQNGLTPDMTPWEEFDCLFLGGSKECVPCGFVNPITDRDRDRCPTCNHPLTEWKLGAAARALVTAAKGLRKWVHMGRVNSLKRWSYAEHIGCDSVDGTFLTFGPTVNLPRLTGWVTQPGFDFGAA